MARATKTEFLMRAMRDPSAGPDLPYLMAYDEYVRDNAKIAAEALHLNLVRLIADPEGLGYQVRITPGGQLLARGLVAEAAAAVDSGRTPTRIDGPAPGGSIGSRLTPGDPPIPLSSSLVRINAAEVLRGIATGHLVVDGDYLHAVESPRAARTFGRGANLGVSSIGARNLGDRRARA
jgi:hypothetical protein